MAVTGAARVERMRRYQARTNGIAAERAQAKADRGARDRGAHCALCEDNPDPRLIPRGDQPNGRHPGCAHARTDIPALLAEIDRLRALPEGATR